MSYIGQIPLPQATEERIERTATAGQTLFTGLTYVNGHISTFINGVKLDNADFTATDGTTVTLATGAAAGDTVSFVSTTQTSALVALPLKDSAGNSVLSESGGVVTLGNATLANSVNPNNNYSYYTMSTTTSSGISVTVSFSSVTTVLEDSDFYSSTFSSNTLTITFQKSGYYKLSNSFSIYGSNNVPTYIYEAPIGGTATFYGLANGRISNSSGLNQPIWSSHNNMELTVLIQANASQTLTIAPSFIVTSNAATNYLGSNIELVRVR